MRRFVLSLAATGLVVGSVLSYSPGLVLWAGGAAAAGSGCRTASAAILAGRTLMNRPERPLSSNRT